jgi:hypothetical protein
MIAALVILAVALVVAVTAAVRFEAKASAATRYLRDALGRLEIAESRMWAERRLRRRAELAAHEARTGEKVRYEDIEWGEGP